MNTDDKHTELALIRETNQRAKRIETRLVTLANKMGHNLTDLEEGITVYGHGVGEGYTVLLKSLDVAISTIGNMCRREGAVGQVRVYWDRGPDKEEYIATLEVKP